jgi:hypothetical protein
MAFENVTGVYNRSALLLDLTSAEDRQAGIELSVGWIVEFFCSALTRIGADPG